MPNLAQQVVHTEIKQAEPQLLPDPPRASHCFHMIPVSFSFCSQGFSGKGFSFVISTVKTICIPVEEWALSCFLDSTFLSASPFLFHVFPLDYSSVFFIPAFLSLLLRAVSGILHNPRFCCTAAHICWTDTDILMQDVSCI